MELGRIRKMESQTERNLVVQNGYLCICKDQHREKSLLCTWWITRYGTESLRMQGYAAWFSYSSRPSDRPEISCL